MQEQFPCEMCMAASIALISPYSVPRHSQFLNHCICLPTSAVFNLHTISYNMEGFKYGIIVGNKCTRSVYFVNLSFWSTREVVTFHYTFVLISLHPSILSLEHF